MSASRQRAEILACRGVYRPTDVCRHYGISRSTLWRIWQTDDEPTVDPPNIWATRTTTDIARADAPVLFERGLTASEIAAELGTTTDQVRAALADRSQAS